MNFFGATLVITISDILSIGFFGLFILFIALWTIRDLWRQWRCKHEKFYENMACHGICSGCGKDLGFIGDLRK